MSSAFRRFDSEPFAGLLRFIAAAPQSAGYIPLATHRRNDECGQSAGCATRPCLTGLRCVLSIRAVEIIADRVLPVAPLPKAAFAAAGHDR